MFDVFDVLLGVTVQTSGSFNNGIKPRLRAAYPYLLNVSMLEPLIIVLQCHNSAGNHAF